MISKLYNRIISELENNSNPEVAEEDKRYHKYEHRAYGIKMPILRSIHRKYKHAIKELGCKDALELASKLFVSRIEEQILTGNYILNIRTDCLTSAKLNYLDRMADHLTSWSTVDDFCSNVLQPILLEHPKETLNLLRKWNKSKNIWKRRASVVAFTRKVGESGKFTKEALELCENLILDKEDLVRKAVGWALKDVMRGDKVKVQGYVKGLRKRGVTSVITLYAVRDLKGGERENTLTNSVFFKPSKRFQEMADRIFLKLKKRILEVLPKADIQHIGSTAIPGSITKGDLDIQVRVSKEDFLKARKYFEKPYEVNQPENWSDTFASFKDDNSFELPVGIQLTVIGSEKDKLFQGQLKLLIENPEILKEYSQMKRRFEGKDINGYYEARSKFFDGLKARGFLNMENKYSLWLMLTGKAHNRFSEIISRLSEEYNSPNFEPHITLIGGIVGTKDDLSAKTAQLASLVKPFRIKLAKIDYFDERHKALLIRAEKTTELMKANRVAREEFNLSPDSEYMPHLSLLYGDFSSETKEKIIKNLGREFNIDFEIRGVCLYFTTGEEEKWHKIKEFPFE